MPYLDYIDLQYRFLISARKHLHDSSGVLVLDAGTCPWKCSLFPNNYHCRITLPLWSQKYYFYLSNKFSDYRLKFYSTFNLFRTSGKSDMFSFDVLLVFRVSVLDTSRMYHLHDLAYYKYHYADLLVFSAKIFAWFTTDFLANSSLRPAS